MVKRIIKGYIYIFGKTYPITWERETDAKVYRARRIYEVNGQHVVDERLYDDWIMKDEIILFEKENLTKKKETHIYQLIQKVK